MSHAHLSPTGHEPLSQNEQIAGWVLLGGLVLFGFGFGVWAGAQDPKPKERAVAKAAAPETPKPAPKPVEKKAEPTPEPPKPEPPPKKPDPPMVEPKAAAKVEPKKPEPKPEPPKAAGPEILFAKQVLPVVRTKCLSCHGDPTVKGGLDLRSVASILKGGDSGDAIKPGDPTKGSLMQNIDDGTMPPPKKTPLTAEEKKLFRDWIERGAK